MATGRTVKALLVDCDGVLNDNEKRLEMQGNAVAPFFGVSWREVVDAWFVVNQKLYDTYRRTLTAEEYYKKMNAERPMRFKMLGEHLKKEVSDKDAEALAHVWEAAFRAYDEHPVRFDDVLPFLERIKTLGVPMVLVSGMTEENRWMLLKKLGIDTYFTKVYASNTVGYQKQQPEFYMHVRTDLGLSGDELAIVGDKCNDDVSAGKLGILTILLVRTPQEIQCAPDHVVRDLHEAGAIITSYVRSS